jgi:hypothetical protein
MKFTIRDLFLVTMIVAFALGWSVDRSRLQNEVNRLRRYDEWLEELSLTAIEPAALRRVTSAADG